MRSFGKACRNPHRKSHDCDEVSHRRYHLYEVAAQRTVENFGLRRGMIRYVIIRDCVSEVTATIDDLQLAALSEVR